MEKLNNIMNVIFQIASIGGIGILIWYTIETYKLRKNSERQLITSIRPYLGYIQDQTNFTIRNNSQNIALNVFLITKINGQFALSKDEEATSAIPANSKHTFTRNEMYNITREELIKRIPSIEGYIDFIASKSIQCLSVIYEDLNGNKLYTIHFGSGDSVDQAGITGYLKDL